ncbi:histidine phosphatase family protein [Halalkalibacter alkalisediminis]|uniref:Histidine phosphatase family protein n=1 Tax=Halalkalibacter alkalisediminis TaxID=935616 RepID=A0ABV6NIT5_9BACI|nr:histidine phosphatase family protein [Halalkalibacter alkalisediminis]
MFNPLPWGIPQASTQPSLLDLLQGGGYILYARHAQANVGVDQPNLSYDHCLCQRNLSQYGRNQAVAYGQTIRRLRIPVMYPVMSSPFCRVSETAALAFGADYVQVDPFWVNIYNLSRNVSAAEQANILYNLHSVLETQPAPGSNKVIIAHSFPPWIGLGSIPDMGTVVVRPRGQGNGYEVVAYLSLEDLTRVGV